MMKESGTPMSNAPPVVYKPAYLPTVLAVLGVLSGFVNVICSILVIMELNALCIIDGIFMFFLGFAVITLETPFKCEFFPFMEKVNAFTAQRTPMQRSIGYIVCGLNGWLVCRSVSAFLGGGSLFVCGALYVWKWFQDRQHAKTYDTYGNSVGQGPPPAYDDVTQPAGGMGGSAMASAAGAAIAARPDLVEKAATGAMQGYMASRGPGGGGAGQGYYP